jgi:cell division protein FtsQ
MSQEQLLIQPAREKNTPKRWGLWLFIPLMAGMITLFVFSTEWREGLKIERVIINGSNILRAQDVYALSNVPAKTVMYDLNILDVQKRIAGHPFVKAVCVHRQVPDELLIDIVERVPIASVNGAELRYIDEDGVMLPYIQSPVQFDLPMISGIDGLEKNAAGTTAANNDLYQAIAILQTAILVDSSVYHLISEIKMNRGNDVMLYASEGGIPILLGQGDVAKKLVTFQTFWNNFIRTDDPERLKYIDLRFDGQVVVKWNSEQEHADKKL